ncbi:MAG: M48 family metallopeptidase, partial [Bacteroidales bacterium]|nr:M48 family metallopeptidase [Bacteroidales bacterium]
MIKRRVFLFFSCFCIFFNSFGQKVVSDSFTGLSPEGNIPEIFRQATIDIAKQGTVSAVNIKDSWKVRSEKQNFFLESSFFFSRIMHSGMILFGDPVTVYLNQVKDALLEEHPSLKDKITIYATKSPYVNAFATPYGIIFINAGLVAQVENEAQLAYIIAHEIIHYVNNHALNMHIEKETTRGWLTSDKNQNEDIFKYHHRSKEMEMEADNLGFLYYYRNSGYDLNEVLQVFDVLLYSYLPFDEVKWDPKYYATTYYSIDTAYLTKKITPITAEEDYDDRESTHPNVKNRKASLEDALLTAAQDNIERKKFLVSEEEFFYIRDLCRLESIRQHVINGDYIQALYNAQIVNASYPSHQVIEDAVAYSLYALGKIRSNTYKGELRFPGATNFEGEISATYHCFNNMPSEELIGLSLRKSWLLSKQYPEKTFYQQVTKYALEALVAHNNFNINNYRFQTPDSLNIMKQKYLENLDTLNMTKLDKIKMQKMLESFNYNNENSLIFCDIED